MGHHYVSPLRYPGGKGKLANFIKMVFLHNGLVGHHYVEPYAGGASVALSLLFEEYASYLHINDLNRSVHAFWSAVLGDTDALCHRIATADVTIEEWHRQRAVQRDPSADRLDLAFSTFFLNRTNRSGILTAGAIGGKGQGGPWKLGARLNQDDLIARIRKIARYRNRITLTGEDAEGFLQRTRKELPANTFVYLDPPYYVKGGDLYENSYDHASHLRIASVVRSLEFPWLLTYDAAPEIVEMYAEYEPLHYDLAYSAGKRYRGDEVMYMAPSLLRPPIDRPAHVSRQGVARFRDHRSGFGG